MEVRQEVAVRPSTGEGPRRMMQCVEPHELREWIDRHRVTVTWLAGQLNVRRAVVYSWLNGLEPVPPVVALTLED